MAEEEGFEPPRGLPRLSVFKTDPFSHEIFNKSIKNNDIKSTKLGGLWNSVLQVEEYPEQNIAIIIVYEVY